MFRSRLARIASGVMVSRNTGATRPVGSTTATSPRTIVELLVIRRGMRAKMTAKHDGHDQQPDHEALVGDRGHELAAGDERDLLRAVMRVPPRPRPACRRLRSAAAASSRPPPPATMRMKTSSSRRRAISMRAGGTSAAMRASAEARIGPCHQRDGVAAGRGLDPLDVGHGADAATSASRDAAARTAASAVSNCRRRPAIGWSSTLRPS